MRNSFESIRSVVALVRRRLRRKRTISRFSELYKSYLSAPRRFTTQDAQHLLRQAFLASKGDCLDWAWRVQRERSANSIRPFSSGLFPALDEGSVQDAATALRNDGFYVLPWRISGEWLDSVTNKTMVLDVVGARDTSDVQRLESIQPRQAVYRHNPNDLAAIMEIKDFALDAGIRRIAAAYLECEPVIDYVGAWWTFPMDGPADADAAQVYHYDLDRIRWLKFFVYLTDVDEVSGPHAFIRQSHRTIGRMIRRDDRHSDDEVFSLYPRTDEVVFVGPRGTVILEDTLGFHKGFPAIAKHRFMFELELSINHFGYPYEDLGFAA